MADLITTADRPPATAQSLRALEQAATEAANHMKATKAAADQAEDAFARAVCELAAARIVARRAAATADA